MPLAQFTGVLRLRCASTAQKQDDHIPRWLSHRALQCSVYSQDAGNAFGSSAGGRGCAQRVRNCNTPRQLQAAHRRLSRTASSQNAFVPNAAENVARGCQCHVQWHQWVVLECAVVAISLGLGAAGRFLHDQWDHRWHGCLSAGTCWLRAR